MPKKCSNCDEVKEFTEFERNVGSSGFHASCKPCEAENVVEKAGLNPHPVLTEKVDLDADLARRKEQYRRSMDRRRQEV